MLRSIGLNNPFKELLKKILGTALLVCISITTWLLIVGGSFNSDEPELGTKLPTQPIIFAHKGLQNYYAENSIEGFVKSKQAGFEAIEADIIQTHDKQLIVFHDRHANRLLGVNDPVNELTFSELENKKIIHDNKPTRNEIMTLEELLSCFGNQLTIYLDFKDANKIIADSLLLYMDKYDVYETTFIADRNIFFLAYLKFREPKIKTVLEGFYGHRKWIHYLIPKNFEPDFYASFLNEVDEHHTSFVKNAGILGKEIVYGVDSHNIKNAYQLGLKNIILDYDSSIRVKDIEQKLMLNNARMMLTD